MIENYNSNLNTLNEQVLINTKKIEKLEQYIKEAYNSDINLDPINQSLSINSTNAPNGTNSGWLLDPRGNLFKISGNEEIPGSNVEWLILLFYANVKGPQGVQGPQGEQGPQGNGIKAVGLTQNMGLDFTMDDDTHLYTSSVQGPQGEQGPQGPQGPAGNIETFNFTTVNEFYNKINELKNRVLKVIIDFGGTTFSGNVITINANDNTISSRTFSVGLNSLNEMVEFIPIHSYNNSTGEIIDTKFITGGRPRFEISPYIVSMTFSSTTQIRLVPIYENISNSAGIIELYGGGYQTKNSATGTIYYI